MKLFEYEAKEIFAKNGIPVSENFLVEAGGQGTDFFKANKPVVLKSQVLTGGRGKAGGIKFASSEKEYADNINSLLKLKLKGLNVKKILVEKKLDVRSELYLGYSIIRSEAKIVFMISAKGGVDIEELAKTNPDEIIKYKIDPLEGINKKEIEAIIDKYGFDSRIKSSINQAALKLYKIFTEYECEVAEINPLVITGDNEVIAADARIAIYDEAIHKHPEYEKEEDTYTELEKKAHKLDLGYVEMDGNIGVIGNGAGLNMAALDILTFFGGKPANFLEVSGRTYHKAKEAIGIVLSNPNVKVIFGNFFGCISRCDVIAEGLAQAAKEGVLNKPIVISMRGTGAKEGLLTLKSSGFREIYEDDIDAGKRAVELSKES